jgi:hypothetical protein
VPQPLGPCDEPSGCGQPADHLYPQGRRCDPTSRASQHPVTRWGRSSSIRRGSVPAVAPRN